MSWNLLSYPGDPVSIADELEAFVHVLVYGCVRFVFHNFNTITGFMRSYFDGFSVNDDREFACPPVKRECLKIGKLTDGDRPITFITGEGSSDHPLNALMRRLFGLFKIRYQVLQWKKTHEPETPSRYRIVAARLAATTSSSSVPGVLSNRRLHDEFRRPRPIQQPSSAAMDVDRPGQVRHESSSKGTAEKLNLKLQKPTNKMREIAASLNNHSTVGLILQDFLDSACTPEGLKKPAVWPVFDKGPDRLTEYIPSGRAAVAQPLQKPSKRQRTMADQPSANAEPSTSQTATKAAPPTRQRSARKIVPPSDRITRSKDGSLPGLASAGRGLPQTGRSTRATTSRGRGRTAVAATPVTRAASGSSRDAGSSLPVTDVRRSRSNGNVQNGRAGGGGSKGGKGKAPARR